MTQLTVITGASSGIGLETAKRLAELGQEVVMVCRDAARGAAAMVVVADAATGPPPSLLIADLSSQREVRALAEQLHLRYDHIDVLINNAGASFSRRELTVDGIEQTIAVNHLAPFLLTNLVLDLVLRAADGRIITVASEAPARTLDLDNLQGERGYNFFGAYTRSKLANIMFTYELARRLEGTRVTANCLSPGPARTHFGDNMTGFPRVFSRVMKRMPIFKSPQQAASTSIYLASSPEVADVSGKFFIHGKAVASKPVTYDTELAARLWTASEQLTSTDTSRSASEMALHAAPAVGPR
jgi:NAD(P)-dependent dehydrogenase (short-subunit alcohol dehydrogenase family)